MTSDTYRFPSILTLWPQLAAAGLTCAARRVSGASARLFSADVRPSTPVTDLFEHARAVSGDTYLRKYFSGHRNICIVDLRMPKEEAFADLASENHQSYAKHHGYRYYSFEGRMSGELFVQPERGPLTDLHGGGLFWQELPALAWVALQKNAYGSAACRWMMWMDNDAVYTNFKITIESIVRSFAEVGAVPKDVILAQEMTDFEGNFINAGVFLVKNSPGGHAFLTEVANAFGHYKAPGKFDDQGAIQGYIFQQEVTGWPMHQRKRAEAGLREDIALVPQRVMNSFAWQYDTRLAHRGSAESEWQPCDWVMHNAGRNAVDRAKSIENGTLAMGQC